MIGISQQSAEAATTARLSLASVILLLLISAGISATSPQTKTIESRLEQAATLISENQLDAAEQQLRSILRSAPNEARALNLIGTIRAQQGKLNEAEALFLR